MARDLLSDASSDSDDAGAALPSADLKVNEAYARRFEHNKKREEKMRLEEKLGKDAGKQTRKRKRDDDHDEAEDESDDGSSESTSESEDEGDLDTEAVDAEMIATIAAIRSRDPKIYDPNTRFYTAIDDEGGSSTAQSAPKQKEKPLHLRDYHRQNLLNGTATADNDDDDNEERPLAYNEEQARLKMDIVTSMHAAADDSRDDDDDDEDAFLTAKEKPKTTTDSRKSDPVLDVENADKDPDAFLSNFMASRAWASSDDRNLVPFESDDDEEDQRADEYEEAYNMRFEDPTKANEKLRSHARDMAAKYSVRREEANPRQRRREAEKAKKEAAKQERKEEKARLRKLRIEEVEAKVQRIKQAAGLKTKDLQPEDWQRFVDEDWDDKRWEEEMQKRFGDDYYAEEDVDSDAEPDGQRKKPKKPKFDDDIDINDLVPDFDDEQGRPSLALSEDDEDGQDGESQARSQSKKQNGREDKAEKRRDAKRDRRIIEALVDDQLKLDLKASAKSSTTASFRYRATSPQSFGLTAQDILLAEDAQLNQFVGLKKLAAFRDPEKKKRDKKSLGKKGRLRKWREEVFGKGRPDDSVKLALEKKRPVEVDDNDHNNDEADANDDDGGGVKIVDGPRKKKKRRRKNKV